MIRIQVEIDLLRRKMSALEKDQLPFAMSLAINRTAEIVRGAEIDQFRTQFDRPTPFTMRSVLLTKPAKKRGPEHRDVFLRNEATKGTPPVKYLNPEVKGGTRRKKGFERQLERAGILFPGEYAVPSRTMTLDAYGNVPGPQIVRILSALRSFEEKGFKANQTTRSAKRNKRAAKLAKSLFVVRRGRMTSGGARRFAPQLPEGIWQRSGPNGSVIKPLFVFVDAATYQSRLPFTQTAERVYRQQIAKQFRAALRQAVGTAR